MAKKVETKTEAAELMAHQQDTGSAPVQISNLTRRIQALTAHLKIHQKDHASRRGLLQMVGKRRRLLDYLSKKDFTKYKNVIQKLGLRK